MPQPADNRRMFLPFAFVLAASTVAVSAMTLLLVAAR